MPLYEYECTDCRNRFEVIRKFSDIPLTQCLKCQGKLVQVISAPALQFKGTGWYVTDYARKSESKPDGGEQKSKSSLDSSQTTNSTSPNNCKTSSPTNTN
ncbi:MAG: zinc ribbon domain-containing protein [Acidobacteria bacterium]|nr:zinc ribbon domain-containing protein [Acidobacteriota bacterium]MBI3656977.1 zinc ribbon domain-containing protein [Acidobacteriota bacterium]